MTVPRPWHLGSALLTHQTSASCKEPKEDMHACTDAMFTVLKGYIVAAACKELRIDVDTESIPSHELKTWDYKKKLGFIVALSMKVVEKYALVSGSILCQAVEETGDKKYDYSRTLCHYACLALEFTDAWTEGATTVTYKNDYEGKTIPTRTHHSFKNVSSNPLKSLKLDKLNLWFLDKLMETVKYRRLQEGDIVDSVDSD